MVKLKPSMYNLIVETQENGAILLANTFSTALCLLDVTQQQLLREGRYDLGSMSINEKRVVEQLISMGFLVNQDIDEFQRLEFRQNVARYGNRHLALTIGPTLNCNMCCPYCFEAEQHQAMTRETSDKLISFIKKYIVSKKIESVHIAWYGGEPLLELRRIEEISNRIMPFCRERNIPYTSSIVTNGYLLDQGNAALLKTLGVVSAQITIDGLEETHNSRRKLKNGAKSFWTIIKNVESVKDVLDIVIRVNVDRTNVHEIDKLTDFFIRDMGWGDQPSFYLAAVDDCGANTGNCFSPHEFSKIYQATIKKLYENGIRTALHRSYPASINVGCSAICSNNFVIDANGYFYTCWRHFGDISRSIGNLNEPDTVGLCGDYFRWLTIPIPGKCKSCIYLPICQSGCPEKRIENRNEPTCSTHTFMCVENLKLTFQEHTA